MKKKKYLYLLLLLILPIIFFGVSKISLNSGSKIETEGEIIQREDTLAATTYTYYTCKRCTGYKISKTGNYIKKIPLSINMEIPNYPMCDSIQTTQSTKCNEYPKSQYDRNLYVFNATSTCATKENYNSRSNISGGECTAKTANSCTDIPVELCKLYTSCVQGKSTCENPKLFNVIFYGQGGTFYSSGNSNRVETCNSTSCAIDMPTPTRSGYKFLGYCKNSKTCSSYVKAGRGVVHTAATSYYAQWESTTTTTKTTTTTTRNNSGYTVNKTAWTTQDVTVRNSSGNNETIKKCSQIYVKTCNGSSQGALCSFTYNNKTYSGLDTKYYNTTKPASCNGSGTTPTQPTQPLPIQQPTTEDWNKTVYASTGASASGYSISCGDELYVTTCETDSASSNPTCTVTKVNGVSVNTTTRVYKKKLVNSFGELPASCQSQKRYALRQTSFYTSTSQIGKKTDTSVPCASEVTINGNVTEACSYSNSTYCKVTYNGTEGYVLRKDLTSSQVDQSTCPTETEGKCYYNSTDKKYIWSADDLSDKYEIEATASTEDECNALNGEGEKNCKTSDKQTEVKETAKIIKICYEKKNDKITNQTDVMDMFTCAKDYTQNPVEQTENTCDTIKNGTCHKTYNVSCSNGTRPALEIAATLLNQGYGTITIKGRKISNDIKSYYLDSSSNPTVDSVWKDFENENTVAYEQKEAGLYYAWVKDDKGILSRPMFAVVHDADITNTLQTLSVTDGNNTAVTLNSIEGENAYLDVMPSEYSLLSNRLKNDTTLAGFDSLSMGYKIEVNSSKISVFATLTSNDASYVEGFEPRTVDLDYGENKILIKIKNKDGKVRTYTIIAIRTDERVSNNLLTDLTVSKGKIEFDPYVTDYDIEVPKNTKKININATLASDTSAFVEGHEPREVELTEDVTTSIIEVISESGITRSYVLTFTKKGTSEDESAKNSAYLDTLTIAGTAIDFNKEIYEYSVTVPYEYSSVNVYAFPESENAFATVEGDRGLKVGANNVRITVENGKLKKTYNVTVIRKEPGLEISNDVTLSSLTIKNYGIDFSPEKLDYTVKIKREKSLIITATPTSNHSMVYMYGNNTLTGFSTVRIKVVAENGATNIYSIDIQKDSYNKALEITAVIVGSVIVLGTGIIIVVRKKNKKKKEYLGK